MKDQIGVVHGRFQLLHNGHMEYILAGKERCEHLIVGICNPDPTLIKYSKANPHRSEQDANPFSYYERYEMVKGSLLEAGISKNEFDIVPFPINYPELLLNYSPKKAVYYMTIYDQWGEEKKDILEKIGVEVCVLWKKDISNKGISGTEVRKLIKNRKQWKDKVPQYVYNYISQTEMEQRIICKL